MGRYNLWAEEGEDSSDLPFTRHPTPPSPPTPAMVPAPVGTPNPAYASPPPQPAPAAQVYSPSLRPQVMVQVPIYGGARRPIELISSVGDGCAIVKGGQPEYDAFIAGVPDLAKQAGMDHSNGVDAMRDFVGRPEFAAMNHWTPHSTYYNKQTDSRGARQIEEYVGAKYSDSVGSIRSSHGRSLGIDRGLLKTI